MRPSNHATDNNSKSIVALIDLHHVTPSGIQKFKSNLAPTAIVPLPDPSTGIQRQYVSVDSHIYEVQSLPLAKSPNYSSFFVGSSTVVSNPHLHLVHRVDPLFFLLPKFKPTDNAATTTNKWQPWNQLVQTYAIPESVLAAIPPPTLEKQLNHLFQVSDQFGDDLILYKFKEEKVLHWLKLKMDRIASTLKESLPPGGDLEDVEKSDEAGATGAFSASFRLSNRNDGSDGNGDETGGNSIRSDEKDDPDTQPNVAISDSQPSQSQQKQHEKQRQEDIYLKHSAVQILCEYLSPSWQTLFLQSVQMTEDDVLSSAVIAKKRRREKLLQSEDDDVTTQDSAIVGSTDSTTPSDDDDDKTSKDPSTQSGRDVHPSMVTPPRRSGDGEKVLSEADKLLQYTMGVGSAGGKGNGSMADGVKKVNAAKSFGLKRLAKVNTKGMKSMTSFFGAGVKKKAAKRTKLG